MLAGISNGWQRYAFDWCSHGKYGENAIKATEKRRYFKMAMAGLPAVAVMFGLLSGSVLAVEVSQEDYNQLQALKKKEAKKQLPPHERPAPAHPAHPSAPPSGNLSQAATNPIANLVQFQLQNADNWDSHNSSGYGNNFIIQPVVPIKLRSKAVPLLITRTTIPYVSTPDLGPGVNRKHGFGDTTLLGLFTPRLKTKGVQLGLGYTAVVPTAGDNDFTGAGKWSAGPSFLYINMKTPHVQWGLFAFQTWSFADDQQNREDVSALSLQPFITLHLNEGWYIATPDSPQTYNFKNDKWTWALGGQVGKVTRIGKLPVKLFVEILNNPENDAGPTYNWQAKFNMTMLFPK
jgi:hypothetical protein